ncbi:MAG: hypothetical protein KAH38_01670, partial [Candidatus Hydrogenedentes bacterium]|nr:hypothetical protein [Candidatus Hydrogenedentota bacterium]
SVFLFFFHGAIYNHFFVFPQQVSAWESIRAERVEIDIPYSIPWNHYRGSAHDHSFLSHDSEVPFEHILQVLKATDRDFIAMSDHCLPGDIADYGAQWRGLHDGKLFIPGFEMKRGFMPWRLPYDTVLACPKDPESLAEEIESLGGLLFIAHPEEPRDWNLPQICGMEIYNTHADIKDENLKEFFPDILLNFRKYPEQTIRLIFDRNTEVLAHWDEMSISKKMVGIAGNDCHQNVGIYGLYTDKDTLEIYRSTGKKVQEYDLNIFTRFLLRILTGPLEENKEAFRIQIDPYELMINYVATHVYASALTEEAILDAFEKGRVYIGFDMLADSSDFVFMARNEEQTGIMGEDIVFTEDAWLVISSPQRCRITIKRHGEEVYQTVGTLVDWQPTRSGKYRVEAELDILGEWTPWVYTNPIELTPNITAAVL